MTYADLTAAIAAWLNRPEAEPSIPTFVLLAEAQMNRDLAEGGVMGAVVTNAALDLTGEYVLAPVDLAAPITLGLPTGDIIENVTRREKNGLDDERRRLGATTGQPAFFTIAGATAAGYQLRLLPVPDKTYAALFTYGQRLTALSDANPTNWLLAQYPDAYLHGALAHSAPFLGEDARLSLWADLYAQAMAGLIKAERAKRGAQETRAYRAGIPHRHPQTHP